MKSILFATIILIASAIYTPSIFAWDFSYSYSNPNDNEAQKYIVEKKNVAIHTELFDTDGPPLGYAWVPARGGNSLATTAPGEITYHFHFDEIISRAKLFMQVTSFNWSYSEGVCSLYASSDRINWTEIAIAPTPEHAGYKMGTYDADLQGFEDEHDIYLRAVVKSYGNRAAEGPPWTNTAQHSRFDVSNPKTTFSLDVEFKEELLLTFQSAKWVRSRNQGLAYPYNLIINFDVENMYSEPKIIRNVASVNAPGLSVLSENDRWDIGTNDRTDVVLYYHAVTSQCSASSDEGEYCQHNRIPNDYYIDEQYEPHDCLHYQSQLIFSPYYSIPSHSKTNQTISIPATIEEYQNFDDSIQFVLLAIQDKDVHPGALENDGCHLHRLYFRPVKGAIPAVNQLLLKTD